MLRSLVHTLAKPLFLRRLKAMEDWLFHPYEAQEQLRIHLLQQAAQTEYGKQYNFSNLRTLEQFQENVPVRSYEELKPYFERVAQGEKNVLWRGKIAGFSKSSGTTGDKSKRIPVSVEALGENHFKGGKDLLGAYFNEQPNSKFFQGRLLALGGSHQKDTTCHYRYGDVSALLLEYMPKLARYSAALSKKTTLLADWEQKINQMAAEAQHLNVTALLGIPTWTLVLLRKLFELFPESQENITYLWPNLELFIHGSVNFEPYRHEFKRVIPNENMYYLEAYNASEGFFAFQLERQDTSMTLLLNHGVFYEFLDPQTQKVFSLEQVELHKPYVLLISTNAGLWRYNIGDVIEFTERFPFKIRLLGRTKLFINAFGEELMIHNTDMAMAMACQQTGAELEDYTVAPVYFNEKESGQHQWLIEFKKEPQDLSTFSHILDTSLKTLNSDYEAKRFKSMTLRSPAIDIMPSGTFHLWLKQHNKLGGQHKVPRLSNNRQVVEEVLKLGKNLSPNTI